eukprot:COSAG02_NODE_3130_length_7311_cov_25.753050_9_plen_103_part_00
MSLAVAVILGRNRRLSNRVVIAIKLGDCTQAWNERVCNRTKLASCFTRLLVLSAHDCIEMLVVVAFVAKVCHSSDYDQACSSEHIAFMQCQWSPSKDCRSWR